MQVLVVEARQLAKDANALKREATALLDQAKDHPEDAARLRSEAKARMEQAFENLEEAMRLAERAHRHLSLQMPALEAEDIRQMIPDREDWTRERESLKGEIVLIK